MGCCCSKSATHFDTTHFESTIKEDDELSSVRLSLATSDGGSDATTPGSAGTPGIDQTFEAVANELGVELGLSPEDDAANKEYITNLKARQTPAPGFNLCDHHDERLRGKPRPKPTKAVEASRSLIIKELRDRLDLVRRSKRSMIK